jgi:hypothetical protein
MPETRAYAPGTTIEYIKKEINKLNVCGRDASGYLKMKFTLIPAGTIMSNTQLARDFVSPVNVEVTCIGAVAPVAARPVPSLFGDDDDTGNAGNVKVVPLSFFEEDDDDGMVRFVYYFPGASRSFVNYKHLSTSTIEQIKKFMFNTEIKQRIANCSEDRLIFKHNGKIMQNNQTADEFLKPVNVIVTCEPVLEDAAGPAPEAVGPGPAIAAAEANKLPIGWTQIVPPDGRTDGRTYYSYQYEKINQFTKPKLPENWIQNFDSATNKPYYVNNLTGESKWPWPGPKEEGPVLEDAAGPAAPPPKEATAAEVDPAVVSAQQKQQQLEKKRIIKQRLTEYFDRVGGELIRLGQPNPIDVIMDTIDRMDIATTDFDKLFNTIVTNVNAEILQLQLQANEKQQLALASGLSGQTPPQVGLSGQTEAPPPQSQAGLSAPPPPQAPPPISQAQLRAVLAAREAAARAAREAAARAAREAAARAAREAAARAVREAFLSRIATRIIARRPPPSTPAPTLSRRILLMNLYLNVIFKVLLLNNILKKNTPLKIKEKYMSNFSREYDIPSYRYPKKNFNDINVINKLNEMLEIKITVASTGGGRFFDKNKFLNDIMNDVSKLKNIKNNKTLKKKIGKVKNRHEFEDKINAKVKKYIKNYLKKKEKQLEKLELQIINAKKNLDFQFNKKENKNKIKSRLNSNINKKINKFNKNKNKNGVSANKNKKNTSRKNMNKS